MDNMFVNINASSGNSGNYDVAMGGGMTRLTTDADRTLFGLSDGQVKSAIGNLMGKSPEDIYYNDPTPWGTLYQQYGWPQVQLLLIPSSSQVTGVNVQESALAFNQITNNFPTKITADVAFQTEMQNTSETNWSNTSTLEVSQSVNFTIEFFGATTTLTFSQAWQQGGSQSKSVTIGSTTSINVDLQPKETVLVQNWGDTGTAQVAVTYQATLSGLVFANYGADKYKGHHFYGIDINSILSNLGLSGQIRIVQNLNLTSYMYTKTVVSKPSLGAISSSPAEGPLLISTNPLLFQAADLPSKGVMQLT